MGIDHIDPNDPRWEIPAYAKRDKVKAGGATKRSARKTFVMPKPKRKKPRKALKPTDAQKKFLRAELGYTAADLQAMSRTRAQTLIDNMMPRHMGGS